MNKTMNKNKDAAPRRWGEITNIALGYQRCRVAAALPWDHERHAAWSMRLGALDILLFGIGAELIAIGLAYGIYRIYDRIPLYALFYVPIYHCLGWTNDSAHHLGLCIIAASNSLKWAGAILLFRKGRWILGAILTAFLLATVFVSISLKVVSI